jgi:L1 cell adhesion molecule like protein
LVLDGGASALKATILTHSNGLWKQEQFTKLESIRGSALVEPLAQAVAQQFEQTHRFPRGEVWSSKRARAKLLKACEESLSSFQRLTNVSIHVDGLYEGMDCNVNISKPKWEHISSVLANQVKTFCQSFTTVDTVLISGNLHDWLTPIVTTTLGPEKIHPTSVDPSEAVALGCTLQSFWNLEQQRRNNNKSTTPHLHSTLSVPCCPVAIGIQGDKGGEPQILIEKGTPLPCQVEHEVTEETLSVLQLLPQQKALAKLEELDVASTLSLQLSVQGRLRIQINGESLVLG